MQSVNRLGTSFAAQTAQNPRLNETNRRRKSTLSEVYSTATLNIPVPGRTGGPSSAPKNNASKPVDQASKITETPSEVTSRKQSDGTFVSTVPTLSGTQVVQLDKNVIDKVAAKRLEVAANHSVQKEAKKLYEEALQKHKELLGKKLLTSSRSEFGSILDSKSMLQDLEAMEKLGREGSEVGSRRSSLNSQVPSEKDRITLYSLALQDLCKNDPETFQKVLNEFALKNSGEVPAPLVNPSRRGPSQGYSDVETLQAPSQASESVYSLPFSTSASQAQDRKRKGWTCFSPKIANSASIPSRVSEIHQRRV